MTRKESESNWKRRFKARLIELGLDEQTAQDLTDGGEVDFDWIPEEAAEEEFCLVGAADDSTHL